jgi:hypothetical protein
VNYFVVTSAKTSKFNGMAQTCHLPQQEPLSNNLNPSKQNVNFMTYFEYVIVALSLLLSITSLIISWVTYRKLLNKKKTLRLPKSILLIRHGESEGNSKEDTYQTTPDPLVPLSAEGRQQCEELGKKLKAKIGKSPVWVYVSLSM